MDEQQIEKVVSFLVTYGTEYAISVVAVAVILIAGFTVAGWVSGGVRRMLGRTKRIDSLVAGFLSNMARYAIIAFAIIAALDQFGVETTSFVAILGAAGLAIGLAFQGTLSNLAAGVMILMFRPFRQGDFVEAGGVSGSVDSVALFFTELRTPDNVQIIVPNSQIWNTSIRNFSYHKTRRCDFVLGIGYGSSIEVAIATLKEMAAADDRVHKEPAPVIVVSNLGDSAVDITIRLWCDAASYWPLRFDFMRAMKERMDAVGVEIPFPQRTVHMVRDAAD